MNPIIERAKVVLKETGNLKVVSLPEHLLNLKEICSSSESDLKDAMPVMQDDPGFMSYIIKMANSAYYNPSKANVVDIEKALIRIGFYFVGNYAILYATKVLHDMENGPDLITERLQKNWELSNSLSESAMSLLEGARKKGIKNNIESSMLMTTSVLYNIGTLCCIAIANDLISNGVQVELDDIIEAKQKLSKKFLRAMLLDIGYTEDDVDAITGRTIQEGKINYIDVLHASIIKSRSEKLKEEIVARVNSLGIL